MLYNKFVTIKTLIKLKNPIIKANLNFCTKKCETNTKFYLRILITFAGHPAAIQSDGP